MWGDECSREVGFKKIWKTVQRGDLVRSRTEPEHTREVIIPNREH